MRSSRCDFRVSLRVRVITCSPGTDEPHRRFVIGTTVELEVAELAGERRNLALVAEVPPGLVGHVEEVRECGVGVEEVLLTVGEGVSVAMSRQQPPW
jgi:hypothetical protein